MRSWAVATSLLVAATGPGCPPALAAADGDQAAPADLHVVAGARAHPPGNSWLTQDLGLTLAGPASPWPFVHARLSLAAERFAVEEAWAEFGRPGLALRLGRFRSPVGRANAAALGQDPLVSLPLAWEEAFDGPFAATGALGTVAWGGVALYGGVAEGGNPFFGGGQLGLLRAAWAWEPVAGLRFELGGSGATNQLATAAAADAYLSWQLPGNTGISLGAEGLAGLGPWRGPPELRGGSCALASLRAGRQELAVRLDALGNPEDGPDTTGLAVAYGLHLEGGPHLRLELGHRSDRSAYLTELPVNRLLAQVLFTLGGPGPVLP